MNPPPRLRPLGIRFASGVVLFAALAMPGEAAAADAERSILVRAPAADADLDPGSGLGPSRAQGDFAPLLAEFAAAASDSVAASDATPAATEASAAPAASAGTVSAREETQPSVVLPILGGIAGGAVGLFGGAIVGLASKEGGGDLEHLGAAVFGGLLGEVVLLPLGVHLGNASKGSYLGNLAISALSGAAGLGLMALIDGSPADVIAGIGLQLGSVVYVERREAQRRIEARRSAAEPAGP